MMKKNLHVKIVGDGDVPNIRFNDSLLRNPHGWSFEIKCPSCLAVSYLHPKNNRNLNFCVTEYGGCDRFAVTAIYEILLKYISLIVCTH
jgi:hypothetical protein